MNEFKDLIVKTKQMCNVTERESVCVRARIDTYKYAQDS